MFLGQFNYYNMAKPCVLIAEDKDYLAKIIRTALTDDFDCICVQTSKEALDSINDVDAAVVSLNLKGVTCDSLLAEMKNRRRIPVIILTSNTTSLIRIKLFREGADDVVTKPFNPEELLVRLIRLVK